LLTEFAALIGLHDMSQFDDGTLKHETVNVLQNILEMQEKQVCQIVTSASNMLMLKSDTTLTKSKIEQYQNNGYSHIFVYDKVIDHLLPQQDDYQILGVLELNVWLPFA
jgi:CBS domain containing-hemolysin-like protein